MTSHTMGLVAIAGMIFVTCMAGLVFCVMKLVAGNRADVLASAPLTGGEVPLAFASDGEVVVMIETPRRAADYRNFEILLVERQTGQITAFKYSYGPAQSTVYGASTAQVPFGRFNARGGAYFAHVRGLSPSGDYGRYRLVLSRPYIGRMALQIAGIVLCGVGLLGSLIWSLWLAGIVKPANS